VKVYDLTKLYTNSPQDKGGDRLTHFQQENY